ncbi:SUMO-activating enzyme subunit 2-like isoform X1 [Zophobas morio]|uniref:SUMO-activating enzyme subunit 2-like isoform X1 n=1 Tax=Zophobas morio TaxID=2755281 RepID=UPI0030839338
MMVERAAQQVLGLTLYEKVSTCKVLVVGAGGIGCEILKNLSTTGFRNIFLVDLDTVDVSNLNRQFLYQLHQVGKSKAEAAADTIRSFNPNIQITGSHADIRSFEYNVEFFEKFDIVFNALDNLSARIHVNRMCLAANLPLIESGTTGYLGQTTVIKRGLTECFECTPKPVPKRFPVCTIRSTPSLPIHCVVWARHLFSQLFGHADDESAVSLSVNAQELRSAEHDLVTDLPKSLRKWAVSLNFDPYKIMHKLFSEDIHTLLSMDTLWRNRNPPQPLNCYAHAKTEKVQSPVYENPHCLPDQSVWSVDECVDHFCRSIKELRDRWEGLTNDLTELLWDKDDSSMMQFVTAAANLRAYAFGIPASNLFEIKALAGSIIPAIATTNAIIAGICVIEALHILSGDFDKCQTTFLKTEKNSRNRLLVPEKLVPPNPKCYACAEQPEAKLFVNLSKFTLEDLRSKILIGSLGMLAPDVCMGPKLLLSSEEEHAGINKAKTLKEVGVRPGSLLEVEDFLQDHKIRLFVAEKDTFQDQDGFELESRSIDSEENTSKRPSSEVLKRDLEEIEENLFSKRFKKN